MSFVGIFLIAVAMFWAGAWLLLALLRWLAAERSYFVPESRSWQRVWYRLAAGHGWHLPAFTGGVLTAFSLGALMHFVWWPYGFWVALALSLLAGWSNPDDLKRYLPGLMLGIVLVLIAYGTLPGRVPVVSGFIGLSILFYVVPAGATVFMAGALVRKAAATD